jgi:hypothetical protein
LAAVRASEAAVRPLTTVELVEDAVGVTPMIGRGRAAEELALTRQQPELDDLLSAEVSLPRKGDAQTA